MAPLFLSDKSSDTRNVRCGLRRVVDINSQVILLTCAVAPLDVFGQPSAPVDLRAGVLTLNGLAWRQRLAFDQHGRSVRGDEGMRARES